MFSHFFYLDEALGKRIITYLKSYIPKSRICTIFDIIAKKNCARQ